MFLKELRINGFKSFANPTQLDLSQGITAIVGPNGCGKSNTADAIRWVLGEQSAKSLRAGNMQDVIFQGTESRKPVNLCEVSLLFSDCEKQLGTAFNEVEISRRVTRDGGSNYYINGKLSRLKDIQRLFMDTGIGQVSYSFMVQGQIDQILSSNPAERRAIFEEAAGITRYKAQRREALNKLKLVDANLARVTDVIEEVARQIGTLKRQASKALRYKKIKRRLTHLDLAFNAHRHRTLKESIEEIEVEARKSRREAAGLEAGLSGREAELEQLREARTEVSASLQATQQTVFELRSQKDQAGSQAEFAGIRIKDLKQRVAEVEAELAGLEEERSSLAERAAGDTQTKREHLHIVGSSDQVFQERSAEVLAAQEALTGAENDLQRFRQDLLMVESNLTRLRSNCTTLEVDLRGYQVKHASQTEEVHQLKEEHEVIEAELATVRAALGARGQERTAEEEALGRLREEEKGHLARFRELQEDIRQVDRVVAQHTAQVGLIRQLQEKFEGFSDGAKAILKGKLESVLPADAFHLLTREVQVPPEHTAAFEAILGPAIDAIFLKDGAAAVPVTEALDAGKLGRACLGFPSPGGGSSSPPAAGDLPDWLQPAAGAVSTGEKNLAPHLAHLLSGCYFCAAPLAELLAYWEANPGFDFALVATAEGELVDRRGLVYGGHSKGKPDSFLQRQAEIDKLSASQAIEEKKLAGLRAEADATQEKLEAAERAVEEKRGRLVEIGQEESTLQAQERGALDAIRKNEARATEAEKALFKLEADNRESVEHLEEARSSLEEAEARIGQARKNIERAEKKVAALREEREAKRDRLAEVRLELAEKRQRLELIDRSLGEIERRAAELEQLEVRRRQEIDTLTEQSAQLSADADAARARAGEIDATLGVTLETLEAERTKLNQAEGAIRSLEENMATEREALSGHQSTLNRAEVKLAREQSQLGFVAEEIEREYELDIAGVDWRAELWRAGDPLPERIRVSIEDAEDAEGGGAATDEDEEREKAEPPEEELRAQEGTNWETVAEEVQSLRSRINAMGPVNLVAIEEYNELRERHGFLTAQSDDLWASKEQLLAAIDDINQTSVKLFSETFEQVRKNFSYTFETLFGGGSAGLELIDAEDVLESGIDIIARPPGTKLRTLALLSGGQRTMTAVALLFAIYMVKPSPFCLLDELDAPLDDANVGRFTDIVRRFTEYSQFIIITHNKRTISVADTIYGVVMQEKGVSKLLSMRFDHEKGKAHEVEAAAESAR